MARKPPAETKTTAGKKTAAKKAAVTKRAAKKTPSKKIAAKKTAAKKVVAKKAVAKKSAAKKAAATKTAAKKTSARTAAREGALQTLVKTAARRSSARISATRRAAARKVESHEALVKKTVSEAPKRARKAAKKTRAKKATQTRAPGAATGKTARSRIDARAAKKLSSPVLRNGARTPVAASAATRSKGKASPAGGRRPPFRLHSLGVRDAHATDWPQIERLLNQTFEREREALQIMGVRASGGPALALVAEYEGEIVGYLAFHALRIEGNGGSLAAAALAPLAVAASRQSRGVGSTLLAAGLEAVRAAGFDAVFVSGPPAYFERFGFSAQDAQRFEGPYSGDAFLALLEAGADTPQGGRLVYPDLLLPQA